jgi:hypothetical protein
MSKPDENVYRACPCGSGQKYKLCCLEKDRAERRKLEAPIGFETPDLLLDTSILSRLRMRRPSKAWT